MRYVPIYAKMGNARRFSSVEIEFQTNTVVKKLGSVFRGDFNNDFNNDFNIKPNENEFNNL